MGESKKEVGKPQHMGPGKWGSETQMENYVFSSL